MSTDPETCKLTKLKRKTTSEGKGEDIVLFRMQWFEDGCCEGNNGIGLKFVCFFVHAKIKRKDVKMRTPNSTELIEAVSHDVMSNTHIPPSTSRRGKN